jgi:hypothetical protein
MISKVSVIFDLMLDPRILKLKPSRFSRRSFSLENEKRTHFPNPQARRFSQRSLKA